MRPEFNVGPVLADVQERQKKLAAVAKYAIPIALFALLAPVLWMATVGVIAAGALFTLYVAFTAAGPVLAKKLSDWRYRSLIQAAKDNPMPTLYANQVAAKNRLDKARANSQNAIAALNAFIAKCERAGKSFSDKDAAQRWLSRIPAAQTQIEKLKQDFAKANEAYLTFSKKVTEAETEYELGLALKETQEALRQAGGSVMEELENRIAFNEAFLTMERAFASLELDSSLASEQVQSLSRPEQALDPVVAHLQKFSDVTDVVPVRSKQ